MMVCLPQSTHVSFSVFSTSDRKVQTVPIDAAMLVRHTDGLTSYTRDPFSNFGFIKAIN